MAAARLPEHGSVGRIDISESRTATARGILQAPSAPSPFHRRAYGQPAQVRREGVPRGGSEHEKRAVGALGVADGDGTRDVAGHFDTLLARVAAAVAGLDELVPGHAVYSSLRMALMSLTEVCCASPRREMRSKRLLWRSASVSLSSQRVVEVVSM